MYYSYTRQILKTKNIIKPHCVAVDRAMFFGVIHIFCCLNLLYFFNSNHSRHFSFYLLLFRRRTFFSSDMSKAYLIFFVYSWEFIKNIILHKCLYTKISFLLLLFCTTHFAGQLNTAACKKFPFFVKQNRQMYHKKAPQRISHLSTPLFVKNTTLFQGCQGSLHKSSLLRHLLLQIPLIARGFQL